MRSLFLGVWLLAVWLVVPAAVSFASAQTPRVLVSGTAADSYGAPVEGASVIAESLSGYRVEATTDSEGVGPTRSSLFAMASFLSSAPWRAPRRPLPSPSCSYP